MKIELMGDEAMKDEKCSKENSIIKQVKRWASFFQNSLISIVVILGIVFVALIASGITVVFHITYDFPDDEALKLKHMEYFFGIYKTIVVSFFVTLFVALLPLVYTEKKDRFERLKESRRAYSEAKTAVIYMPYKLSEMTYLEGVSALEEAHVKLHMAQTYPELAIHLYRLGHSETPKVWAKNVYDKLVTMKKVLRDKSKEWDDMKRTIRLETFQDAFKEHLRQEKDSTGKNKVGNGESLV